MKKKFTLSINDDLIEFAHEFSKETDQPISHIAEEYLDVSSYENKIDCIITRLT